MFESIQSGLSNALRSLRGKGKLSEANMRDGLELVQQALLEADVSYDVAKDFIDRVSAEAVGEKVLNSLDPTQQLVGIVHHELINLMGPVDHSLHFKTGATSILMLCGLQGSGKTTTCGKLGRLIQQRGRQPMLVAADLQRPAAIDQLHVIGEQLGLPVYSERGAPDPVAVCQNAVRKATEEGIPVVILDTAGRLHIDDELMAAVEADRQPRRARPGLSGGRRHDRPGCREQRQGVQRSAGARRRDHDQARRRRPRRRGAVGQAGHRRADQVHRHRRASGRTWKNFIPTAWPAAFSGMGDVLTLVEQAQQKFDQDEMAKARKSGCARANSRSKTFREQMRQIAKLGPDAKR